MTVAGCSTEKISEPEENRIQSAIEAIPQSESEPEPEPEPTTLVMTDEEAGDLFLEVVCGINTTVYPYNDALNAAEDEYLAGGDPDMAGVQATAKAYADAVLQGVTVFDDEYYVWPDSVTTYIRQMKDGYLGHLDPLRQVQQQTDYGPILSMSWPNAEMPSQKIRYELSLESDPEVSCVDRGGKLAGLAEESKARKAG